MSNALIIVLVCHCKQQLGLDFVGATGYFVLKHSLYWTNDWFCFAQFCSVMVKSQFYGSNQVFLETEAE